MVMIMTLLRCVDWPLLTFDLCEIHLHPKLASGVLLTKFGSHIAHFTTFDLC